MAANNPTPLPPQQPPQQPQQPPQQPPTPPPAPAPAPLTPGEMTPQQIRDTAAGAQPQPQPVAPQAPQAPVPGAPPQIQRTQEGTFFLELPTGQRYIGNSPEEVQQRLIEGQINASRRITELSNESKRMRDAASAALGRPVAGGETAIEGGGQPSQPRMQWDSNVYAELNRTDPGMAQDYYWACRLGLNDIAEVPAELERIRTTTMRVEQSMIVNQFRASAPDFPGTEQAVDALMSTMNRNRLPFTPENLVMAHRHLVQDRVYAPAAVPAQPGQPPAQPAAPPQPPLTSYDPNPSGLFAYDPGRGGFVPVAAPAPQVPPPAPYPMAPAPPNPYAAYPAAPAPHNQPLPTMPTNGGASSGAGALTEDSINGMSREALRGLIEGGLQR